MNRHVRPSWVLMSAAAVLLSAAFLSGASNPTHRGGPSSQIAMIADFRDDGVLPDRIKSDGLGSYVHGLDQVKAILDATGNFDLDTVVSKPVIRKLFLDFAAVASCPEAGCWAPFESGLEDAYMSTGGGGLPNMAVGASIRSKLQVTFASGVGTQWFLRFDPGQYPETSNVLVTRTASDTWEIQAAPTDVAKLLSAPTKGRLVLTDRGNYFMPFKIVVRKK